VQWIVAGLAAGYIAPNILKWYWWRLNGTGYFSGMVTGTVLAMVFPRVFPVLSPLNAFPFITAISTLACVIVSFVAEPDDAQTLKSFYRNVRPWGFWKPVHEMVIKETPDVEKNTACRRDLLNCGVGIIWQTSIITVPIFLVIREYKPLCFSVLVLTLTSIFLKVNWFDKLEKS